MSERRRGDEFVTHRELREALQPLFDLKARSEPSLRFWEKMHDKIETFLPELLREEEIRQLMVGVTRDRWRRFQAIAIIVGGFAALAMIGDLALSLYLVLHR